MCEFTNENVEKSIKVLFLISKAKDVNQLQQFINILTKEVENIKKNYSSQYLLKQSNIQKFFSKDYEPSPFTQLSPHCIIDHILPFFEFKIIIPLENFGYFKNDKMRHIYQLTKSLKFAHPVRFFGKHFFACNRLNYLYLKEVGSVVDYLNDVEFPKLNFLKIKKCLSLRDVFFSKFRFKALKKLIIVSSKNISNTENWNVKNFINLEDCRLFNLFINNYLFINGKFNKLKNLVLVNNRSLCGISWSSSLRALTSLSVINCGEFKDYFFQENDFPELSSLLLSHLPITGTNWKEIKNLRELRIESCYKFHEFIFQNYEFRLLRKLELSFLEDIATISWNNFPALESILIEYCNCVSDELFRSNVLVNKNLKEIDYRGENCLGYEWNDGLFENLSHFRIDSQNEDFNKEIFGKRMKHLEKLSISIPYLDKKSFGKFKIRCLSIRKVEVFDVFFHNDVFSFLTTLELFKIYSITGKSWKILLNLKSLKISKCSITDEFFVEQELAKLESLYLFGCEKITGVGWNKINNLRRLEIDSCFYFLDELFQSVEFGKLEILTLCNNSEIMGIKWKNIKNLMEISLICLRKMSDQIFIKQNWENLRKIKISDCSCLNGMHWKKKNLLNLESFIVDYQKFTSRTIREYRFPKLKTLTVFENYMYSTKNEGDVGGNKHKKEWEILQLITGKPKYLENLKKLCFKSYYHNSFRKFSNNLELLRLPQLEKVFYSKMGNDNPFIEELLKIKNLRKIKRL